MLLSEVSQPRTCGHQGLFAIDSDNTDIYVQPAFVAHEMHGHLLIRCKQALIRWQAMCSEKTADILVSLHAPTGCKQHWFLWAWQGIHVWKSQCTWGRQNSAVRALGSTSFLFVILWWVTSRRSSWGIRCEDEPGEVWASKWGQLQNKSALHLSPDQDAFAYHSWSSSFVVHWQCKYQLANHCFLPDHGLELFSVKRQSVQHTRPSLPGYLTPCGNSGNDQDTEKNQRKSLLSLHQTQMSMIAMQVSNVHLRYLQRV